MPPTRKPKTHEALQIRPYQTPLEQRQEKQRQPKEEEQKQQQRKKEEKPQSFKSQKKAAIVVRADDDEDDEDEEDADVDADADDEEGKKSRGSWTAEKQLTLLQKYAQYFPPGAAWGKSTEAWQMIVDGVNAVAPNDTPLRYDACRRAVDKISNKYIEEESIQKAALEALTVRDKCDDEKIKKLIKQEYNRERKRMKRMIIQRLAQEKSAIVDQMTRTDERNSSSSSSSSSNINNDPLPAEASTTATKPVSYVHLDEAYVKEQREFQLSVLVYMENMSNILEGMYEQLKKKE